MSKFEIVITPGDPDGIGPEVCVKALTILRPLLRNVRVTIIGNLTSVKGYQKKLSGLTFTHLTPSVKDSPGRQAGWSIEQAARYVMNAPQTRALITGPISKERLQQGGYRFFGHTDFLAHLTSTKAVTMMLANDIFKVSLVTDHCSLAEVPKRITPAALSRAFLDSLNFCSDNLKIKKPKIAFLALNPHSGEGGILGTEEIKTIVPCMKALQKKHKEVEITGPHPADSFFANELSLTKNKRHDLVIAMYHDQGLIPVKLADFSNSLNMTLGLPMIRTSVDHGTAFNIAGKNKADPSSMVYAIKNALIFLKNKEKHNG